MLLLGNHAVAMFTVQLYGSGIDMLVGTSTNVTVPLRWISGAAARPSPTGDRLSAELHWPTTAGAEPCVCAVEPPLVLR